MGGSFLSGQLTAAIERADNNKTQAHYSPTVGWLQSQQKNPLQTSSKDKKIFWKTFHFGYFKASQLAVKFQDSFIIRSHLTESPTGA